MKYAVIEVADQTVILHYPEGHPDGYAWTSHAEARLWDSREEVEAYVASEWAAHEANLLQSLVAEERYEGAHAWAREQLARPRGERYGDPWIEEVEDEAAWRAQEDTW